jgi:hypothetical protein
LPSPSSLFFYVLQRSEEGDRSRLFFFCL